MQHSSHEYNDLFVMKLSPSFELLIIVILLSPFAYLFQHWQPDVFAQNFNSFLLYCFFVIVFYFIPLFFQKIDKQKPNAVFLLRNGKHIRLIWTAYLAALGFILFYYSLHHLAEERNRFLGIALSLFLFASGNFQQNLHPSSAFSGNGWLIKTINEKNYRASQRFTARLFFWVGIIGTIFFLNIKEKMATTWGLIFVGMVVFYGIFFRLVRNLLN